MSQARQYELIYVVASDATDQQIADLHTQVEEITGRYSGTLDKTENWGRRKLAYEIGPHKEGTYVLEVITGSGELMKEIDRRLRVSDQVIRHLTVRVDEENRVIERARTLRKEDSQRRRVARGLPPERQPGEGPQRNDDDDDRFGGDVEEGIVVMREGRGRSIIIIIGRPRRTWRRQEGRQEAHAVPAPEGLQVLRGQDRRHQLQGRQAAGTVRAGARQDSAAPHLGHLCDASAQAADGHQARASARVDTLRH